MTRKEAKSCIGTIEMLQRLAYNIHGVMDVIDADNCNKIIKALEQEPSADVMAIHTQGLDEGIRCAMCTNSMKSDSGCDGGCIVNEDMYKKVMETINNHIFSQPTSEDCVSREQEPCEDAVSRKTVLNTLNRMDSVLDEDRTVETYKELLVITICHP